MYHSPQRTLPFQQKYENTINMYPDESQEPFLDIIEHPKARGFRFRYSCEGPSHGGIPGASSDKNKKTYPAVQIRNHSGYARIVVQLVTNEENPRLHPHSLVGKQCQNGICTVQCGPKDMTATFPNLGIQHVTKKNVAKILEERYLAAEMQLSSLNEGLTADIQNAIKDEDKQRIRSKASAEAKSIDLSVVRLMFIAYLPDSNGAFTLMLKPVISDAIFDSKSPNAATLKICRMDKTHGAASGMDEIYLLCDKVQKDDIQVRFFEEDEYGNDDGWDAYGDFSPTDVHRQFAIVFRTPRYKDVSIDKPVQVQVQLRRRSDGEVSEPRTFTYMPVQDDPEQILRKRKKVSAHFEDHVVGNQPNGNAGHAPMGTYRQSGGFVFQSSGNNTGGGGKQTKRFGPPPRQANPQKGPLDPSLLLYKMHHMKQEPASPPMMNGGMMMNNGVSSQEVLHGSHAMVPSPQGSDSSQGINANMRAVSIGSSSPHSSSHGSPMSADLNGVVAPQISESNFIPGTRVPFPQMLANSTQAQPQISQQQWVQMQTVPVQYQQVQLVQQQTLPSMQLQGQFIYAQVPPTTSSGNALYFDPGTGDVQAGESYALEEVIGQEVVGTNVDEDINDFIATTLSGFTGSAQTFTSSASGQMEGPIMDILMNSETQIVTDAVSEETKTDAMTKNVDDEGFSAGMQDTSVIPEIKTEKAVQDVIEADSCAIERQLETANAPVEVGKNKPKVQVKESQPQTMTQSAETKQKRPPPNITDDMKLKQEAEIIDRLDKTSLQKLLVNITIRTAKAMQDFAATGDIRIILATQRRLTDIQDSDGDTPLHLAVINGQDKVLLALIQLIQTIPSSGEIINRMNDTQLTPLHIAVHSENANAVKWLMGAGADAMLGDSRGNTAIHLACSTGQADLLEYMLMKSCDGIEPHNYNGLTPLHTLASKVSESARQCISLLIKHGHNVDSGDMKSGRTALHIAAEENNLIVAGYLISECNADLECRTFSGLTPLHIAVARDSQEIATLLLACGADPQSEYSEDPNSIPLSLCVSSRMRDILEGGSAYDHCDIGSEYSSLVDSSEDLYSLEPIIKMKLSRLLDPISDGKDWYALAKRLGLGALIGIFEDEEKSPTETLLENYSCIQGTVTGLRAALTQIDRQDAIDVLNKSQTNESAKLCHKDEVDLERVDSAFESMTLSESQNISIPQC
uniref:nuclear factor NF-kappa-B p100 subunit-like isoform X2 n=1 Tax=Styela clava TaxID=7725 RepID=UPI001939AB5D|nr:nuclear factor NF-kappa-B p100 subunit-like isoform X2 [Styela clava]